MPALQHPTHVPLSTNQPQFNALLGLGGQCSGCDDILTVSDLIGIDLNSKGGALI